jgi:hypothetical protein
MNKDRDMRNLRYPRTLAEAFGPYETGPIHDPVEEAGHRLAVAIGLVTLCALIGGLLAGVL